MFCEWNDSTLEPPDTILMISHDLLIEKRRQLTGKHVGESHILSPEERLHGHGHSQGRNGA